MNGTAFRLVPGCAMFELTQLYERFRAIRSLIDEMSRLYDASEMHAKAHFHDICPFPGLIFSFRNFEIVERESVRLHEGELRRRQQQ
jgi:hypothetical protein